MKRSSEEISSNVCTPSIDLGDTICDGAALAKFQSPQNDNKPESVCALPKDRATEIVHHLQASASFHVDRVGTTANDNTKMIKSYNEPLSVDDNSDLEDSQRTLIMGVDTEEVILDSPKSDHEVGSFMSTAERSGPPQDLNSAEHEQSGNGQHMNTDKDCLCHSLGACKHCGRDRRCGSVMVPLPDCYVRPCAMCGAGGWCPHCGRDLLWARKSDPLAAMHAP